MQSRLCFWMAIWLLGGYAVYRNELMISQAQYDAGDLSAFAWHGFLPFLIPIFLMYSGFVVGPLAAVCEGIFWWGRRKTARQNDSGHRASEDHKD